MKLCTYLPGLKVTWNVIYNFIPNESICRVTSVVTKFELPNLGVLILQFSMSRMTSHRAFYSNFLLPFIIKTMNFDQGYLVMFSPEMLQHLIESFSQCIFYEYEEKTVSNFTLQVTFKEHIIKTLPFTNISSQLLTARYTDSSFTVLNT